MGGAHRRPRLCRPFRTGKSAEHRKRFASRRYRTAHPAVRVPAGPDGTLSHVPERDDASHRASAAA
ncbi:hypothetical protein [Streptomyces sp. NPDC048734]|uniref:hypothetical protein n=1 Tax=Streptomyces sp. NPDC048734 TaxID=3365590 RepID=UPI003715F85B